ncbi:MAG: hypothetical protein ACLFS8_01920 [Clostridia bacterium]
MIARALEERGISTATVSIFPEVTSRVIPPRTVEVPFPYGAPFGDPGNVKLHMTVLRACLKVLREAPEGGYVLRPPVKWREKPAR